jgi:hypothetical protein
LVAYILSDIWIDPIWIHAVKAYLHLNVPSSSSSLRMGLSSDVSFIESMIQLIPTNASEIYRILYLFSEYQYTAGVKLYAVLITQLQLLHRESINKWIHDDFFADMIRASSDAMTTGVGYITTDTKSETKIARDKKTNIDELYRISRSNKGGLQELIGRTCSSLGLYHYEICPVATLIKMEMIHPETFEVVRKLVSTTPPADTASLVRSMIIPVDS